MVLSTALFDKPAFKNLICNGLVLAADGKKMSKRLKNYPASVGWAWGVVGAMYQQARGGGGLCCVSSFYDATMQSMQLRIHATRLLHACIEWGSLATCGQG